MTDDLFDGDDDLFVALDSTTTAPTKLQQPVPQKIQQPVPQRLDRAPPVGTSTSTAIIQPTPQALAKPSSGTAIQVSPRQRGNPVLASLKTIPWEYSDIPADYGLGLTTGALFLSLKYHRLHPEYIYSRIRNLQGKYSLRVLLTMVDIPNHEDSLRELSKTSLVNNVTLILCWSAAEAARYLELYKSYEHANYAAIRGQQSSTYAEKLVEFVTVPRGVNKADAIALACNFGSLKNAINAEPEQIGMISGWGEKKVKKWCRVVDEPFRAKKAARRAGATSASQAVPLSRVPLRDMTSTRPTATPTTSQAKEKASDGQGTARPAQFHIFDVDLDEDDEEAMIAAAIEESKQTAPASASHQSKGDESGSRPQEVLSDGVAAALARLRENGG